MISVGIDTSLTNTGLVRLEDGQAVSVVSISSKPSGKSLEDRLKRLEKLTEGVLSHIAGADIVVIEAPAYGKAVGNMHERSGLW